MLRGYGKIYAIGHPATAELFSDDVVVQEKIDGSQFSAGVVKGELLMRSKGSQLFPGTADKLFKQAVNTFEDLYNSGCLIEGWVYRGESVSSPKHNTLQYDRAPKGGVILFDIDTGLENYLSPNQVRNLADDLGLESVQTLFEGKISSANEIRDLMTLTSSLGGEIEGLVVKNYTRFGRDGRALMGKLVSEKFKETHFSQWKKSNPSNKDVIQILKDTYRTKARWLKAIQRLRDNGELEDDPRDIGKLIKEIPKDIKEECEEEIKEALFKYFFGEIGRYATRGFPEFYKQYLLERAFDDRTTTRS